MWGKYGTVYGDERGKVCWGVGDVEKCAKVGTGEVSESV